MDFLYQIKLFLFLSKFSLCENQDFPLGNQNVNSEQKINLLLQHFDFRKNVKNINLINSKNFDKKPIFSKNLDFYYKITSYHIKISYSTQVSIILIYLSTSIN